MGIGPPLQAPKLKICTDLKYFAVCLRNDCTANICKGNATKGCIFKNIFTLV